MLINARNLSQGYQNTEIGLLTEVDKEQKLFKAELFDFQPIKKLYPYFGKFLWICQEYS